jgi:sortase A
MRSHTSLSWLAIGLGVAGTACAAAIFFVHTKVPEEYSANAVSSTTEAGQPSVGTPVFLVIPKINVDAAIAPVGITSDGAMDVPAGPTDTAWFDLGPRPGEVGSAVIAGHEGWKDGIRAVFDNLHTLRVGDQIYTQDDRGVTSVFVVRRIATYDQNADASEVFGSDDGGAHLNLITCEGTWNTAEKSYSDRLVVFADLLK